jgi:hypothetical protein
MGVKRGKILDFGPMGSVRRSLYVITTLSAIPHTIGCSYSSNGRCQRWRRREIADVLTVIGLFSGFSQVLRGKAYMLGDPCQHLRAYFFTIMECKYVIRPTGTGKNTM